MPRPILYLLGALLLSPGAHAESPHFRIEISKSKQSLRVLQEGTTIRSYRIAYGSGGRGTKLRAGDHKTPEGDYHIIDINPNSRFQLFFLLDYPNQQDIRQALHDGRIQPNHQRRFEQAARRTQTPPQNTPLGGSIGIHGLGHASAEQQDIHQRMNWTKGCIAITNREIRDLKGYISIGTPVSITR